MLNRQRSIFFSCLQLVFLLRDTEMISYNAMSILSDLKLEILTRVKIFLTKVKFHSRFYNSWEHTCLDCACSERYCFDRMASFLKTNRMGNADEAVIILKSSAVSGTRLKIKK